MTVILQFPPETEQRLREHAAQSGQSVEGFIRQLVERAVIGEQGSSSSPPTTPMAGPSADTTLDAILAPIRQGFRESGLTEEELEQLFQEAREEVWQQRQKPKDRA